MDVKKLPFRCAHCRKFLNDNECIVFQIPAAGESHICQHFDLDFRRIFPASQSPFISAFLHWCNSGIMSPALRDIIKLIEIDPLRETVFDDNEWKQAKELWLEWLLDKFYEYSIQLSEIHDKTRKKRLAEIPYKWDWQKEYGEDEKKMTRTIFTNTHWEQYVHEVYHGRGPVTDGLIPMIVTAVFKILKEDGRLKRGDKNGKNESGND